MIKSCHGLGGDVVGEDNHADGDFFHKGHQASTFIIHDDQNIHVALNYTCCFNSVNATNA